MKKPAKYWEKLRGEKVQCKLCPRRCIIKPDALGYCRGRKNENGELLTIVYGQASSLTPDPIEKKPFYHFHPGSRAFSISTVGCNFECKHCQNWAISQSDLVKVGTEQITPEELVSQASSYDCGGIAYTYGEPVIWFEFCLDSAKLAHKSGLYNVFVTNGYMELEAWNEISPYLDAMNVDVKAFNDEFYREVCGVPSVQPVLDTCEWAFENDIHLEITNLVIPDENDDSEQIRELCQWIVNDLDSSVPVHFSRFHPLYNMTDRSQTPVETLERALDIAEDEGLKHAYIGNVPGHESDHTYCPECGELLIKRDRFTVTEYNISDGDCPKCGFEVNIVGGYNPEPVLI